MLDRFGQIEPVLFIACDGYWYDGKRDRRRRQARGDRAQAADRRARSDRRLSRRPPAGGRRRSPSAVDARRRASRRSQPSPLTFERLPFAHPLYILFSSGTTGVPKCIVHSAGGTLLQHLKEHRLHCGIERRRPLFYFTTCGWMMWNWLVSGLASGATLLLYDGSPFHPDGNVLFDFAAGREDDAVRHLGEIHRRRAARPGFEPADTHDLSSVRTDRLDRLAAGAGELRLRLRRHQAGRASRLDLGRHRHRLAASCSASRPSRSGAARSRGRASAWRSTSGTTTASRRGRRRASSSAPRPFPSMPVGFWNDPDGKKYHAAYFERFPNVWCHGDFAEWTEHGGMIIHGRSDATLNPGGVRIGTAEIYSQVEQMPEVPEAIVHRPGLGRRRARRAVRAPGSRASRSTRLLSERIKTQDPHRRQPAPRAGQDHRRSPTSRAPSPARSPSLPCATSCMAGRSRTRRRSPTPRRWSSIATLPSCASDGGFSRPARASTGTRPRPACLRPASS